MSTNPRIAPSSPRSRSFGRLPHGVRDAHPEDLPRVADLWMRVFRKREAPAPEALVRAMHQVFFEHPLRGTGLGPLVLADDRGALIGFIGLMPRRFSFGGRPLLAAVATQLMVDPRAGRPFAAFELLRTAFSGPQELTFSDGANELSQPVWERVGGHVARLFSLEWSRVLRPAGHAALRIARARPGRPYVEWTRRIARAADFALARVPLAGLRAPRAELGSEDAGAREILPLLEAGGHALAPCPEPAELEWVLARARETRGHGPLRARVVRGPGSEPVGHFIHYAEEGGLAQVLELGGRPRAMGAVLDALFEDAWAAGCVAVTGQGEPWLLRELDDRRAVHRCKSYGALVHAKDPEVLAAVLRGDAMLTRLAGEWWIPFAERAE